MDKNILHPVNDTARLKKTVNSDFLLNNVYTYI